MNSLLFSDVAIESPEAWGQFQLAHGVAHQGVYEAMLRNDLVPFYLDLFVFPREDNQTYLLDHYQAHLSNAGLLGIQDIPDLSTYDLSSEWADFAALHAVVHFNENQALGLQ